MATSVETIDTSRTDAEKFELQYALEVAREDLKKMSAEKTKLDERLKETGARLKMALESNTALKRKMYATEAATDEAICILNASKQSGGLRARLDQSRRTRRICSARLGAERRLRD